MTEKRIAICRFEHETNTFFSLEAGLEQFQNTVGDKIEITVEGHSRWDLTVATKIAPALEPYNVMWLPMMETSIVLAKKL